MMRDSISRLVAELARPARFRPRYKLLEDETRYTIPEELRRESLKKPSKRYVFAALDAAAATLHVPAGEVSVVAGALCDVRSAYLYPGTGIVASVNGPPFLGAPIEEDLSLVSNRYVKVGLKYVNDPDLPEGALSHDLRIHMETYLLSVAKERLGSGTVLLIDGPVTYPYTHPVEGSVWNAELGGLNEDRVTMMSNLIEEGIIPVCVVKRVWRSKHLIRALGLSELLTDVKMIMNTLGLSDVPDKPLVIGPWEVSGSTDTPPRVMAYVLTPVAMPVRLYTIFRIEVLKAVQELLGEERFLELIAAISYSASSYGTYVPHRLHVADALSKEVVTKNASVLEAMLRLKGVPLLYGGVTVE